MEWVSSKQLMEAMGAFFANCSPEAQRACTRAHAGLLRARAKRFCTDAACSNDVDVPLEFWWAEGHEALTQDWESGDFETWLNQRTRLRAFGVEWCKEDAEAMGVKFRPGHGDCYLELADLEPIDREAGARWTEARYLRWFDAALWVGSEDMTAAATLAGYRAFQRRQGENGEVADGAAELVGQSLVPPGAISNGVACLLDALSKGTITAFGSDSPDGAMTKIETVEWARPFDIRKQDGVDCLTAPNFPWPIRFFNLVLDATAVFARWPVPHAPAPEKAKPRRTRKRTEKPWQRSLRALIAPHVQAERRASDQGRTPPALSPDKELQRALGTAIPTATFAVWRSRIYDEERARAFQNNPA